MTLIGWIVRIKQHALDFLFRQIVLRDVLHVVVRLAAGRSVLKRYSALEQFLMFVL